MQQMWKIRNKGSATVEMAVIMPFIIGVVYMYIMYLLFSVSLSIELFNQAEQLYSAKTSEEIMSEKKGTAESDINILEFNIFHSSDYEVTVELSRNKTNPVQSIRRWQLAYRTIS